MAKDNPFEVAEDLHQNIDEHAQGAPKKNWKLIMVLLGLVGLVVGVYFLPSDIKKEIKPAQTDAPNPQQTREILTKQITGDANDRENPKGENDEKKSDLPSMPGRVIPNGSLTTPQVRPGANDGKNINPFGPTGANSTPGAPINNYVPQGQPGGVGNAQGRLSPQEEMEKRREDIWASSIDGKGIKLRKQPDSAGANPYDILTTSVPGVVNPAAQLYTAQTEGKNAISNLSDPVGQAAQIAALTRPPAPAQAPTKGAQDNAWLANQAADKTLPPLLEQGPPGGTILQQGTIIRGALLSGINTDLPGTIAARVVSDVYDSINQEKLLIPKGSKLIGIYNHDIVVGQERVLVAFTRLIRPDGSSIQLAGAAGADMQGVSGLPGEVNNHFFKIFSAAAIIGAASALSGGQNVTVTQGLSGTQTGGNVMAQALSESVSLILQRNKNIAPTITKKPAEEFMFITTRDMRLSPTSNN